MMLLTRLRRSEHGAAAVEMAIVLPVIVFLAFGIIDFGRIMNAEIQLSQAAREGARLAALSDGSANYGYADVISRVQQAAPAPGFGSTTVSITNADIQLCPHGASITANGSVTVHATFQGILWPPSPRVFTQRAIMRCAG